LNIAALFLTQFNKKIYKMRQVLISELSLYKELVLLLESLG